MTGTTFTVQPFRRRVIPLDIERSSAKFRRLASLRSAATSKFSATVVGGVSAGGQLREIRLASAAKIGPEGR